MHSAVGVNAGYIILIKIWLECDPCVCILFLDIAVLIIHTCSQHFFRDAGCSSFAFCLQFFRVSPIINCQQVCVLWHHINFIATTLCFWWSCIKRPIHSVKLNNFTVWCHTWWKNWVNCAVLTGNSAGLTTALSSRLSHTELRSSLS